MKNIFDTLLRKLLVFILARAILAASEEATTATAAADNTAPWAIETDSVEELGTIAEVEEFIHDVDWVGADGTTSTKLFIPEFEKFALCFPCYDPLTYLCENIDSHKLNLNEKYLLWT